MWYGEEYAQLLGINLDGTTTTTTTATVNGGEGCPTSCYSPQMKYSNQIFFSTPILRQYNGAMGVMKQKPSRFDEPSNDFHISLFQLLCINASGAADVTVSKTV